MLSKQSKAKQNEIKNKTKTENRTLRGTVYSFVDSTISLSAFHGETQLLHKIN